MLGHGAQAGEFHVPGMARVKPRYGYVATRMLVKVSIARTRVLEGAAQQGSVQQGCRELEGFILVLLLHGTMPEPSGSAASSTE